MTGNEILSRLLVTLILSGLGVGAYWFIKRTYLTSNEHKVRKFHGYQPGKAGIILFSSPTCAPCKTVQKPVINRIMAKMGSSLQYIEVDASIHTDLANEWGVVSVPTTYIFEPSGRSRFVHFGLVTEKTLIEQLKELL